MPADRDAKLIQVRPGTTLVSQEAPLSKTDLKFPRDLTYPNFPAPVRVSNSPMIAVEKSGSFGLRHTTCQSTGDLRINW
jgi:hypothetical protein